ncbi:MAG: hypothetical protein IPJ32_01155 [Sphingobacteriaceae bacterium]|nr:hypothetical protein [Sphingobacteriaceae bacterium]
MENTVQIPEKKPFRPFRFFIKTVLWLTAIVVLLGITAVSLVFVYEDEVKSIIIGELNKNLKSEVKVDPKNIDLTFIKSFPKCALEFKDVLILEAIEKKERDTLIFAENIRLMFNLKDLWNKNYTINKINISGAQCNLGIDRKGRPNYIFWKKSEGQGTDNLKFALKDISLQSINLKYRNTEQKVKLSLSFKEAVFSGDFGNDQYALKTEGKARLEYLTVNKTNLLNQKNLKYDAELDISKSNYKISKAELALNEIYFATEVNFNYTDSLETADFDFTGKNLDIASVLSLLPEKYASRINDYKSEGDFFSKGSIKYKVGEKANINAEFGVNNATVTYKQQNMQLTNLNIQGKLSVSEKDDYLNLQNVSAQLGSNTISGFCLITNLSDPYLNVNVNVNAKLEDVNNFWPIDTLEFVSGSVQLNAAVKGSLSEMKQSAFSPNVSAEGSATLKDIKTKFKGKQNEININQGGFVLNNRNVAVNDFKLLIGTSDVELNGQLPGFLNYLFDPQQPLVINAALKSNTLVLEDVLYGGTNSGSEKVNIPANLNFDLNASIANFSFAKFEAQSVSGVIAIHNQKIVAQDISLTTMDGKAQLNAMADASGEIIAIKAASDLQNINITKLFYQFNNFGQSTLSDKHLKGFATANINFTGNWTKELQCDLQSVTANGSLTITQGRLVDFKPLESLSKYVEVSELKDIKFSSLQSAFDIKNQIITIPKTNIKNSALNMELWGKHTFKNEIDYHIKLLLSELLASKKRANKQLDEELEFEENDPENRRSVYILMTGTVDNPIIKYDRKGLKQKIGEDLKAEKQTLKQILKEEFGLFKKDSTINQTEKTKAQNFKIETENKTKKSNNLQPKKKEEDDEDF